MKIHCDRVSVFFNRKDQAEAAYTKLVAQGIHKNQISFQRANVYSTQAVVNDGRVNASVGMGVRIGFGLIIGAVVGMLMELSLPIAQIHLFATTPSFASVILIGWGMSMGGSLASVWGAIKKNQRLEKIFQPQFTLTVEIYDRQQTVLTKSIMEKSSGGHKIQCTF